MKKKVIVLGLVALLLLGLGYAYAQGPGYGPGVGYGPESGRMHSRAFRACDDVLNLTPEQKAKVEELRRKFDADTAQIQGALVTKRLELRTLWTNPDAEAKVILEKEKELRDLQNQMRDKRVQFKLETRKLLTPEQISKFGAGWGMGQGPHRFRGRGMGMGGFRMGC
ncbi:MAG: hypothetical protein A2162_09440 [Deltaproteobacteria bacterium RBG_13_52_11b]|nr:MAG: hypothetical protein A2162_09440 [Deltaproteobacteria bacterium RBG_13_52_11b]